MTVENSSKHPLTHWTGPFGLPDYSHIKDEDFAGVFDEALKSHDAEIESIASNTEAATIENTLAALELCGDALDRVEVGVACRAPLRLHAVSWRVPARVVPSAASAPRADAPARRSSARRA